MSKGRGLLRTAISSPFSSIFPFFFFFFFFSVLLCCAILAVGETPSSSPSPVSSGNGVRGSSSAPESRKPPPPRRRGKSSIMAALKEAPQYSGLVSLIAKANLTVSLDTTSPLTVFAPTNDAIEETLPLSDTKFLTDPKNIELLKRFVFFHFVNSKLLAANLTVKRELRTLEGENLIIDYANGTKLVSKVDITAEDDIIREDGVVHGIFSVLIPLSVSDALPPPGGSDGGAAAADALEQSPSSSSDVEDYAPLSDVTMGGVEDYAPSSDVTMGGDYSGAPDDVLFWTPSSPSSPSPSDELVAALKAHPNYSLIGRFLASAGPASLAALDSLQNDTLFAPSNQGLSSSFQMAQLLTNETARNDILFYHILAGRYEFSWLEEHPGVYDEDSGFEVVVRGGGTEVLVGNPASLGQIITPDLYENPKVVVHGINKVLLPPKYAEEATSGEIDLMTPTAAASLPLSLSAAGWEGGSVDAPVSLDELSNNMGSEPGATEALGIASSYYSAASLSSLGAQSIGSAGENDAPMSGSWIIEYPADDEEGSFGALGSFFADDSLPPPPPPPSSAAMPVVGALLASSSSSALKDEVVSSSPSSSSMRMTAAADAPLGSTTADSSDEVGDANAAFISALAGNSNYNQIAGLVGQVGPAYLGDLTNNTLFAPSNRAITSFRMSNAALISDIDIAKFHVLNGTYSSSFLKSNPGDYGGNFSVVVQGDNLRVGYSSALGLVAAPDLYASTTIVIHGVDRVLLPPKYAGESVDSDVSGSVAAPSEPVFANPRDNSAAGANGQSPGTNGSAAFPFRTASARPSDLNSNAGVSSGISPRSLGVLLVGLMIDFLLFFLK